MKIRIPMFVGYSNNVMDETRITTWHGGLWICPEWAEKLLPNFSMRKNLAIEARDTNPKRKGWKKLSLISGENTHVKISGKETFVDASVVKQMRDRNLVTAWFRLVGEL